MRVEIFILALLASSTIAITCTINKKIPAYTKCDPRWGSLTILGEQICSPAGIFTTHAAIAFAFYGVKLNGQIPTPAIIHDYLSDYRSPFTYASYGKSQWFLKLLSFWTMPIDGPNYPYYSIISGSICNQRLVTLLTKSGDRVIATSCDDNGFHTVDTDGKTGYLTMADISSHTSVLPSKYWPK